jgi:phosphoglycerol transferase
LLTTGGLVDEIGRNRVPDYEATKSQYEVEGDFVRKIEEQLPAGSMVYQLPYLPFPESPPLHDMVDYDPVRLYLHSSTLHFSYAAVKGREVDRWQRDLNDLPIEQQLSQLVDHGFSGIAVDRAGYADRAADVENQLSLLLNQQPLVSADQRRSFFMLPGGAAASDQ